MGQTARDYYKEGGQCTLLSCPCLGNWDEGGCRACTFPLSEQLNALVTQLVVSNAKGGKKK